MLYNKVLSYLITSQTAVLIFMLISAHGRVPFIFCAAYLVLTSFNKMFMQFVKKSSLYGADKIKGKIFIPHLASDADKLRQLFILVARDVLAGKIVSTSVVFILSCIPLAIETVQFQYSTQPQSKVYYSHKKKLSS